MGASQRIAVVMPARNEERFIREAIVTIPSFVAQIIVVDDASTDRTSSVALSLPDARVRVARHLTARGVGAAIVTGYREALASGAEIAVVMAGDAQMDPCDLPALISPITEGRADYVKGNRLEHPSVWATMPIHRLLGTAALGKATAWATGLADTRDSQCGYTAISCEALRALDLSKLWPGYGYVNDMLARCARAGLRVETVPVRPIYRGERSGLRPWHLLTTSALLVRARAARALAHHARQP